MLNIGKSQRVSLTDVTCGEQRPSEVSVQFLSNYACFEVRCPGDAFTKEVWLHRHWRMSRRDVHTLQRILKRTEERQRQIAEEEATDE